MTISRPLTPDCSCTCKRSQDSSPPTVPESSLSSSLRWVLVALAFVVDAGSPPALESLRWALVVLCSPQTAPNLLVFDLTLFHRYAPSLSYLSHQNVGGGDLVKSR